MSDTIDRAVELLKAGIAEIDEEAAQLRRSLMNLDGSPVRSQRKTARSSKGRRRKAKRAAKGQRREEVLAALKTKPDAKTSEIARQIGISSNQVSGLRKQLAVSGKLKGPARKQKPKRAKRKAAKAAKASPAKAAKK